MRPTGYSGWENQSTVIHEVSATSRSSTKAMGVGHSLARPEGFTSNSETSPGKLTSQCLVGGEHRLVTAPASLHLRVGAIGQGRMGRLVHAIRLRHATHMGRNVQ